jgi:hypothetical protein
MSYTDRWLPKMDEKIANDSLKIGEADADIYLACRAS